MNTFKLINDDCLNALKEIEDNSIDSIITDPPYGLSKTPDIVEVMTKWLAGEDYTHRGSGFMGKSWDSFVPGPAVWRECFRVLKPGGHLIAFAGSRTYDLMAIACRMGGFEIRDQGMWLYGSGFPKSLDVSKAIDKSRGHSAHFKACQWIADTCQEKDISRKDLDAAAGTSDMGGWWASRLPHRCQIPTLQQWESIAPLLGSPPDWLIKLIRPANDPGENFKSREVVGKHNAPAKSIYTQGSKELSDDLDITKAKTPEAQKWTGWGTALKPAHEPFVIARKPFKGTVADNVLEHGTGGINVDGCRVWDKQTITTRNGNSGAHGRFNADNRVFKRVNPPGRFPANLIHDNSEAVEDILGDKARYFYSAKAGKKDRNEGLDEFETKSAAEVTCSKEGQARLNSPRTGAGRTSGSKNTHPTVKPVDLMTYLCSLITPEGGTVLDPFTGSGSTGKAAIREGFNFIGIEMDPEYCEIAKARIEFEINKN